MSNQVEVLVERQRTGREGLNARERRSARTLLEDNVLPPASYLAALLACALNELDDRDRRAQAFREKLQSLEQTMKAFEGV